MKKELIIVYDGAAADHLVVMSSHNLIYYLNFFYIVRVLYWAKKGESTQIFMKENGRFVFYPYSEPYDSGYITGIKFMKWIAKTLWKICDDNPKDVKQIFMTVIPIWAGIPTLIVGKLKKNKTVLRLEHPKIEGLIIEDETWGVSKIYTAFRVLILKAVYFLTVPFFDYVICISEYVLKDARKYYPRSAQRIHLIIDSIRFSPRVVPKNNELTVISVGQIKIRKGLRETLEAIRILKEENGLEPKVLIVGKVSNPRDEIFLKECRDLARGLNVEFLHNVDSHEELARTYNRSDIYISASYIEGLGLTVMEAMASGLPVIATNNSGSKDLVDDVRNGFSIEPRNARAIKEKLLILLQNSELRKSMGLEGRKKIDELTAEAREGNNKFWSEVLS